MVARQEPTSHQRDRQRRRTRKAIVDAAAALIARGESPSMSDIAAEADVSRRTVYLYFPTLEQLLLDATLGLLTGSAIDEVLSTAEAADASNVEETVDRTIRALGELTAETLPLGRSLIKLTVDRPAAATEPASIGAPPRRGYRRVEWIERAITPLRERLSPEQFEHLVSALAVVIGWEAFIVLSDVRGLPREQQIDIVAWSARALVRAALTNAAAPRNNAEAHAASSDS